MAFLGFPVLLWTVMATVNVMVDPYGIFGRAPYGIRAEGGERASKAAGVANFPHDGLLLGSSRVAHIDPDMIDGYRFYNAAFSAAVPEEFLGFLQNNLRNEKLVIIGIDFFMMNETSHPMVSATSFAAPKWRRVLDYSLSWRVFAESLTGISDVLDNQPVKIKMNGARNPDIKQTYSRAMDQAAIDEQHKIALSWARKLWFRNFVYCERRLNLLRDIANFLEQSGVRLLVFLAPEHREFIDGILAEELTRGEFERWRRDMKTIFPKVYDFSEAFQDDRFFFNFDPSHYTPETGKILIDTILAGEGLIAIPVN